MAPGMLGFLFLDGAELVVEPDALAAVAANAGGSRDILAAASTALLTLDGPGWTAAGIEQALRAAIVEGLGVKPKLAFTPVRVAVTGRRVSPPLFESMEILGPDETGRRLAALGRQL